MTMKKGIKTLAMWLIIGVIVIVLLSSIMENSSSKMTYSELVTSIENKEVENIKTFYNMFGEDLPEELKTELKLLETRLKDWITDIIII